MLPCLRRLRIAELAAEIRACLHLCAEGAHGTKIGFVVDHDVGIPRHSDVNLSNINMRPVGRITSYCELAEIDRKLAEILGIAGEQAAQPGLRRRVLSWQQEVCEMLARQQ